MKQKFTEWKPSLQSLDLVTTANNILDDYESQGYVLTLRQLYYQLVSRDIIPNNVKEYTKLGNVISRARLAGLIDWSMIEDRTRVPETRSHWESPSEIIESAVSSYYLSRWENQKNYIEVWCEKDAVSNIIKPVCRKWDILFMANRGYSSQSAIYNAHKRLAVKGQNKSVKIIYLGDHDPSGMDMDRDINNRIEIFTYGEIRRIVKRIALNMEQVEEFHPPENPAKQKDSRFEQYVVEYGESSWELDALEPSVLADIIEKAIMEFVDLDEFDKVAEKEQEHKDNLIELTKDIDWD